jgi:hypothetical protein
VEFLHFSNIVFSFNAVPVAKDNNQVTQMRKARYALIILIIVWVFLSMIACIISGGGGGGGSGTPQPYLASSDDVTATYGADMFHEQLTAISRDRFITPAAQYP